MRLLNGPDFELWFENQTKVSDGLPNHVIRWMKKVSEKLNAGFQVFGIQMVTVLMYANLANFRVLLKSLGGFVALDKVDGSHKTSA